MSIKKTIKPLASNNLSIFLIISLSLHLILLFALPEFSEKHDEPRYVSVPVIIEIPEPAIPAMPSGEIVDIPKELKAKEPKRTPSRETAKRLADRQLQSDKETSPKVSSLSNIPESLPKPEQPLQEPEHISEPKPMQKQEELVKEREIEKPLNVKEDLPKDEPKAKEKEDKKGVPAKAGELDKKITEGLVVKDEKKEANIKPTKEEIAQVIKEEKKEVLSKPDNANNKDDKGILTHKIELGEEPKKSAAKPVPEGLNRGIEIKEEPKKTAKEIIEEKPAVSPQKEILKDEKKDIGQKTKVETLPERTPKKEIKEPEKVATQEKVVKEPEKILPKEKIVEPERVLPKEKLFPSGERLAELDKEYQQKGVPGIEEGKTLSLNTSEFRYHSYLFGIKRRIELAWNYPYAAARAGQQGKLELSFSIKKDGTVEEIKLLKSSGYAMLDNEAISAIRLAAPFKEFPKDFNLERFTIAATFEYIIQPYFFRREER